MGLLFLLIETVQMIAFNAKLPILFRLDHPFLSKICFLSCYPSQTRGLTEQLVQPLHGLQI